MFKFISLLLLSILSFSLISIEANSQKNDLLGTWKGKLIDSIGEVDYQLKLIDEKNGQYIGTSISNSTGFYCETDIVAIRNGNKFLIIESGIKKTNYEKKELICLLKFELILNNKRLVGNYTPISNKSNCLNGKISLTKDQIKLIPTVKQNKTVEQSVVKNNSLVQNLPKESDLRSNKNELNDKNILEVSTIKKTENNDVLSEKRDSRLIKTIELDDDEAELLIYDNGAIDGDIITLIDNGRVLLKNAPLSQKPITLKINNLDEKIHKILFFAENLGEIAPNTGLLVIKTKTTKINLFFSSDLVQSSYFKIIFK